MVVKKLINRIKPKQKHRVVTLGYAMAVMFAFILSLTNNNDVNASVSFTDKTDYLLLENTISENVEDTDSLYPAERIGNIRSLFNLVDSYQREKDIQKLLTVSKGDTFISILNNQGLSYEEAHGIYSAFKKVYNPASIRIGQKILINGTYDTELKKIIAVKSIVIEDGAIQRHILQKSEDGKYAVSTQKDELIAEVNSANGTISGSLSQSMNKQGVPNKIVNEFIKIFSYSVDFRRDVRKGDRFEIIFENNITKEGKIASYGNILYAGLQLRNEKVSLYRFKDAGGNVDYYTEKGYAMKKTLHKKPLAFQNARISSPFGKRYHPILKHYRIHWGVDYAAPKGTKIFAGGDGVVQVAKYNGAYGNYIKIRHNSEYSTAYGHMWKFEKGIRPGVRVKQGQVIAYVGSTGRSTGPHLHYEVIRNGKRVNPTTIKASTGKNLAGKDLKNFKKMVGDIKGSYTKMFAVRENPKLAKK